ncbi:TPA: hypothetical protein ACH3X1_011776 [Trebouxia sp. C0004]
MPIVLTLMEILVPAWELDLNWHKMIHQIRAIRQNGPCWTWAMFRFERFWKHLTDWMTQRSHIEATIFNVHYAFKTSCLALPQLREDLLSDEEDEVGRDTAHSRTAQCSPTDCPVSIEQPMSCCCPASFEHMKVHLVSINKEISPLICLTLLATAPLALPPDKHSWQAELHLFYVQSPELCQACTCCGRYDELWERYMQVEVSGSVTKQRLSELLGKWYEWGKRQPDFCQQARQLCSGPLKSAQVSDRATLQGIFSTTKTEGKKNACESVVLMSNNHKFWAGRVRFFLRHTPPRVSASNDSDVYIARVHWYNHLPEREAMSLALGCPVFKASYMYDSSGNMWPLLRSLLLAGLLLSTTRPARIV